MTSTDLGDTALLSAHAGVRYFDSSGAKLCKIATARVEERDTLCVGRT